MTISKVVHKLQVVAFSLTNIENTGMEMLSIEYKLPASTVYKVVHIPSVCTHKLRIEIVTQFQSSTY